MLLRRRKADASTPLDGVDVVLADLDGVVYQGSKAIPHAIESLNAASESARVGYITNNASRTDAQVASHLRELGLDVAPTDVVTSPQAAVKLLSARVPAGSVVLVVGGDGLVDEVVKAGFEVTRSAEDEPAAVIQGFSAEIGWNQLAEASFALSAAEHPDRPWIATNMDWTIPVERGIAPGNGTLVSAVHSAVGRLPVVAGKPETPIFEAAIERFGARCPLFIGDRLDTDIVGANRAKIRSALVLTGVDRGKQAIAAGEDSRPTYLLSDLSELGQPYPEALVAADGSRASVGDATVRLRGNRVEIVSAGGKRIDLLRAGCALVWGSGRPIYGLEVPEEVYR